MVKMATETKKKQEGIADIRERVEVVCTEKNPFAKTGTILKVSPYARKRGIEIGHYEDVKLEKSTAKK